MESPYCDPDARDLALTLYRKHMAKCVPCETAWWAWDEERVRRRKYMTKAEKRAEAQAQSLGKGL
jgi:hypothetical protein